MLAEWLRLWTDGWNAVTLLIGLTVIASIGQGIARGASSSAKRLGAMVLEGALTVISLFVAWKLAVWLSPKAQAWLTSLDLKVPAEEIAAWKQFYYTFATSLRDFELLRFGILLLLAYSLLKSLLYRLADPWVLSWMSSRPAEPSAYPSFISSTLGGMIGGIVGGCRALLVIALLFGATTLFPQTEASQYIQASSLYRMGAAKVIEPVTGDLIADQLPVFTRAVEEEFANILQRKYEVLDANIPTDIAEAAKEITAAGKTDEDKAELLYDWVGTRVQYDWEKVRLYEEERIWKEQTPEQTFASREGVCIDYSRLYAVMARAVGLDVKVVTGLGYDGQGGYGPHAWNEVYLSEEDRWAPLDSTWVSSGGDWFDPPNFEQTHIREA